MNDEDKKPKGLETCVINRRLNFQNYKNCLEPAQIENKINHLEKQRFGSEKHNAFTEGINNIGLSSNDDKRMQPIDLTETYAYRMNKNLVCKKEEIKCNNTTKQHKNV